MVAGRPRDAGRRVHGGRERSRARAVRARASRSGGRGRARGGRGRTGGEDGEDGSRPAPGPTSGFRGAWLDPAARNAGAAPRMSSKTTKALIKAHGEEEYQFYVTFHVDRYMRLGRELGRWRRIQRRRRPRAAVRGHAPADTEHGADHAAHRLQALQPRVIDERPRRAREKTRKPHSRGAADSVYKPNMYRKKLVSWRRRFVGSLTTMLVLAHHPHRHVTPRRPRVVQRGRVFHHHHRSLARPAPPPNGDGGSARATESLAMSPPPAVA